MNLVGRSDLALTVLLVSSEGMIPSAAVVKTPYGVAAIKQTLQAPTIR
jgi:hypothetical protein